MFSHWSCAPSHYPVVSIDLTGFALDAECFQTCVQLVQSYILSVGYSHQSIFSDQTLIVVEKTISNASISFATSGFNVWTNFCSSERMISSPNIALCVLHFLRIDVRPSMLFTLSTVIKSDVSSSW